ncbi:MAG: TetR/AcrR family transcriptional regulator [Microthrixaceae bacterium]
MDATAAEETKRGPGRPRDLAKRQAILDAAREVLAEVGYTSMTIDAVAQRAGSNRVLIYRVWDTKLALAADALFGTMGEFDVPDTGSLTADLRGFIAQHVERMSGDAYLKGLPGLTVELLTDADLYRWVHVRFVQPSEDGYRTILERARARGELAGDVDPRLITRVISGATTSLAQTGRLSREATTDTLLRLLLGGLIPIDPSRPDRT